MHGGRERAAAIGQFRAWLVAAHWPCVTREPAGSSHALRVAAVALNTGFEAPNDSLPRIVMVYGEVLVCLKLSAIARSCE